MSINTISGLNIRDRDYNSYFQQGESVNDSNFLGSPTIGKIVGGVYYSGTQSYNNLDGVPLNLTSTGEVRTAFLGSGGYYYQDKSSSAIPSINYEHHEIHDGDHFFICGFGSPIGSGIRNVFGITTPAGSKWAHTLFDVEGTTQTELRVYENSTLSGGVTVTPLNNNRNSTNSSVLTIKSMPVVSGATPTSGTLIFSQSKGLEGSTPSKASATGVFLRDNEIILKSGTSYIFEFKSVGAGNIINYCFEWYEKTDRVQQW